MGRKPKNSYDENRERKAKERLQRLVNDLERQGISQREIVRRMFPGLIDEDPRVYQNKVTHFSKVKSSEQNNKVGFSIDYAQQICDAINKYPNDSEIHSGRDIRWQWLSGLEDSYPTYHDKEMAEYKKEAERSEEDIRKKWEESPYHVLAAAFDRKGFELIEEIDPSLTLSTLPSGYMIKAGSNHILRLTISEMADLQNEINSYADYLTERLISKRRS